MLSIFRSLALALILGTAAHALYLQEGIRAIKVPSALIKVDGLPDSVWKAVSAYGYSQIQFNDYAKVVLLASDPVRNDHPSKHFLAPDAGSVTFMAAYDEANLYFFFLVKENDSFDPGLLCQPSEIWKGHAAEVFVDPNPWSASLYTGYFGKDATGLTYGTSPKSIQLDKPIHPSDTRFYFRDGKVGGRFELRPSPPAGLMAVSARRSPQDSLTFGVEMRIPFWTDGKDFSPGKDMFISWGYNHFKGGEGGDCSEQPIAYRWAKHYRTYTETEAGKPPGWKPGDSTHYDPLRSWDGWGRLSLSPEGVEGDGCTDLDTTRWDLSHWAMHCGKAVTGLSRNNPPEKGKVVMPSFGRRPDGFGWDFRGRRSAIGSAPLILPLRPLQP